MYETLYKKKFKTNYERYTWKGATYEEEQSQGFNTLCGSPIIKSDNEL